MIRRHDTQADRRDLGDLENPESVHGALGVERVELQFDPVAVHRDDTLVDAVSLMSQDNRVPVRGDSSGDEAVAGLDRPLWIPGCRVLSPENQWDASSVNAVFWNDRLHSRENRCSWWPSRLGPGSQDPTDTDFGVDRLDDEETSDDESQDDEDQQGCHGGSDIDQGSRRYASHPAAGFLDRCGGEGVLPPDSTRFEFYS